MAMWTMIDRYPQDLIRVTLFTGQPRLGAHNATHPNATLII
jgi:hypothetical protein